MPSSADVRCEAVQPWPSAGLLFRRDCAIRHRIPEATDVQLHRDVDLDIAPSLFSRDTTDRLELSQYILEDLLNCKVDCRIIVCIRSGAKGNETEASYSDQARSIASSRNNSGITTVLWRMSADMYHVLQGTISRSSFSDEVMTDNLFESRFLHYFHTRRGDFGILFNGKNNVLTVPWYDVIWN